jgi:hypothetical protein
VGLRRLAECRTGRRIGRDRLGFIALGFALLRTFTLTLAGAVADAAPSRGIDAVPEYSETTCRPRS